MLYTSDFLPKKDRKFSFLEHGQMMYFIPSNVPLYACIESINLQDHTSCLFCNVNVEDKCVCYVSRSEILVTENYFVYMCGVPMSEFQNFKKRKFSKYDDVKCGPTLCPFHADTKPSAYKNENGSVYCFHDNCLYPSHKKKCV